MPKINRTAILSVDAIRAFEVVNRVEGYPIFYLVVKRSRFLNLQKNIQWSESTLLWLAFLSRS